MARSQTLSTSNCHPHLMLGKILSHNLDIGYNITPLFSQFLQRVLDLGVESNEISESLQNVFVDQDKHLHYCRASTSADSTYLFFYELRDSVSAGRPCRRSHLCCVRTVAKVFLKIFPFACNLTLLLRSHNTRIAPITLL